MFFQELTLSDGEGKEVGRRGLVAHPGCEGGHVARRRCQATSPGALSLLLLVWWQWQEAGSGSVDRENPSS